MKRKKNFKRPFKIKSLLQLALMAITACLFALSGWIGYQTNQSTVHEQLVQNKDLLIYSTENGNLQRAYVNAVLNAKKSIVIMVFAFTDHSLMQAIRKKSEEGVDVKVVCDAKACPYITEKLGPKVKIIKRLDKGLMHLKIMVIDDLDCWIGSANFTGESLKMHSNLVIEIKDAALANTLVKKAGTLKEYDRLFGIPHTEYVINGQLVELSFLPEDRLASQRIKDLIRSAKKSIKIAMFTFTRMDFAKELIRAKRLGVDVQVVLDNNSSLGSSSEVAALFEKEKINVSYSIGKALLHHKFLLVDDETLEIGSANWTKNAFNTNDDCFLIIHHLADDQKEKMIQIWNDIVAHSSKR